MRNINIFNSLNYFNTFKKTWSEFLSSTSACATVNLAASLKNWQNIKQITYKLFICMQSASHKRRTKSLNPRSYQQDAFLSRNIIVEKRLDVCFIRTEHQYNHIVPTAGRHTAGRHFIPGPRGSVEKRASETLAGLRLSFEFTYWPVQWFLGKLQTWAHTLKEYQQRSECNTG